MRTHHIVLLLGVLIACIGAFIADRVQTAGGTITVQSVQFIDSQGKQLHGLLYVPPDATEQRPAPGILAMHGYLNSCETQNGFAIEFARRGYVVLALDQTGHGLSEPPAYGSGFGGPEGLMYLRGLGAVDPANIGIEGHSMGGWAALAAAASDPDGYRAMVLVGSAPGTFGAPAATTEFPRNVAVIAGTYDEFSLLMWDAPTGASIAASAKLKAMFGAAGPVEAGRLYGDADDGTARVFYAPRVTHPGEHISTAAIGQASDWFQHTLRGGTPKPSTDQIWYWKEFGTLIAMCGMVVAVIGFGLTLLRLRRFREFVKPVPPTSLARWPLLRAALSSAIPVLTYIPLFDFAAAKWPPSQWWPQQITNGVVVWSLANTLIALGVMALFGYRRVTLDGLGIWPVGFRASDVLRAMHTALWTVLFGYLLLLAVDALFAVDFRIWVVSFKRLASWHLQAYCMYLPPLTVFFIVMGASIREFTMRGKMTPACLRGVIIVTGGFIGLLAVQYVALLLGKPLPFGAPLLTVLAIQFAALLAIAAIIATVFQRASGSVYVGAFVNALLITWSVVGGQATHYAA